MDATPPPTNPEGQGEPCPYEEASGDARPTHAVICHRPLSPYNPRVPNVPSQPLRIAFLISGSGSTLLNVLERIADDRLPGVQVVGVIGSRACAGLNHGECRGIPTAVIERGTPFDVNDFSAHITAQLDQWQPDLIVLGGFLSHYIPSPQYVGRVINTHPALLPAHGGVGMYGDRVHAAVLAGGSRITGCTVHIVNDEYDAGAILAQRAVAVLEDDTVETLGTRVRGAERELLPAVIGWFAAGRVSYEVGKVEVRGRNLRG
jgi:phosphoribosylglycinamide formyltransferase-1